MIIRIIKAVKKVHVYKLWLIINFEFHCMVQNELYVFLIIGSDEERNDGTHSINSSPFHKTCIWCKF